MLLGIFCSHEKMLPGKFKFSCSSGATQNVDVSSLRQKFKQVEFGIAP
jgi:hypothetical protein